MSDRTTLKSYFETGDTPTQAEFADLIDSTALTTETITTVGQTPITFKGPHIYGTFSSPISGASYAVSTTDAQIGIVQKIYLTAAWTPPASHVKIGGVEYNSAVVNIVFVEYSEAGRIEYWIAADE